MIGHYVGVNDLTKNTLSPFVFYLSGSQFSASISHFDGLCVVVDTTDLFRMLTEFGYILLSMKCWSSRDWHSKRITENVFTTSHSQNVSLITLRVTGTWISSFVDSQHFNFCERVKLQFIVLLYLLTWLYRSVIIVFFYICDRFLLVSTLLYSNSNEKKNYLKVVDFGFVDANSNYFLQEIQFVDVCFLYWKTRTIPVVIDLIGTESTTKGHQQGLLSSLCCWHFK